MLLEQRVGTESKCSILLHWKGHDEGYWAPDLTLPSLNCSEQFLTYINYVSL